MSIFGKSAVEKAVDQLTADNLQESDYAGNLDMAEFVNKSSNGGKDVLKALRKRLTNTISGSTKPSSTPQHQQAVRVSFLALTLLEMLIKNCNIAFHQNLAHKDNIKALEEVATKHGSPIVREQVLVLIESCAEAFNKRGILPTFDELYKKLKSKGIEFPARDMNSMAPVFTPPARPVERASSTTTTNRSSAPAVRHLNSIPQPHAHTLPDINQPQYGAPFHAPPSGAPTNNNAIIIPPGYSIDDFAEDEIDEAEEEEKKNDQRIAHQQNTQRSLIPHPFIHGGAPEYTEKVLRDLGQVYEYISLTLALLDSVIANSQQPHLIGAGPGDFSNTSLAMQVDENLSTLLTTLKEIRQRLSILLVEILETNEKLTENVLFTIEKIREIFDFVNDCVLQGRIHAKKPSLDVPTDIAKYNPSLSAAAQASATAPATPASTINDPAPSHSLPLHPPPPASSAPVSDRSATRTMQLFDMPEPTPVVEERKQSTPPSSPPPAVATPSILSQPIQPSTSSPFAVNNNADDLSIFEIAAKEEEEKAKSEAEIDPFTALSQRHSQSLSPSQPQTQTQSSTPAVLTSSPDVSSLPTPTSTPLKDTNNAHRLSLSTPGPPGGHDAVDHDAEGAKAVQSQNNNTTQVAEGERGEGEAEGEGQVAPPAQVPVSDAFLDELMSLTIPQNNNENNSSSSSSSSNNNPVINTNDETFSATEPPF